MKNFMKKVGAFVGNEEGQGLVEYVLVIAIIALVVIAAMKILQGGISNSYNNSAGKLANP